MPFLHKHRIDSENLKEKQLGVYLRQTKDTHSLASYSVKQLCCDFSYLTMHTIHAIVCRGLDEQRLHDITLSLEIVTTPSNTT